MKKVIKLILSLVLFFLSGISQMSFVYAKDLSGEFKYGSSTGYYIVSKSGSHGSSSNALNYKQIKRAGSDTWEKAFCMEPGVSLNNGVSLTPSEYTKTRISRLAYLGYYSQMNAKNYINTQALIYDELGDEVSYVSTGNYDEFKEDVLQRYNRFEMKPHFNDTIVEVDVGDTKTLTDKNKVLEDYETFSIITNGICLNHIKGNNTIDITVSKDCKVDLQEFSESMMVKENAYKFKPVSDINIFYKNSEQDLALFGFVGLISMNLSVKVNYKDLTIYKLDEHNKRVPQTSFLLSYNKDMSEPIGTYTTDANGIVKIDKLLKTKVYVQEVNVPDYLVLDKTVHEVDLAQNNNLQVYNEIKKGKIKVVKKDSETNNIILKEGIEFSIFDKQSDQLIEIMKTDDQGIAYSSLLEYGNYYIKETKAPSGYVLSDEIIDVDILEDAKIYEIVMKNRPVSTMLSIEKRGEVLVDYQNNQFIYQEQGLEGVVFEILAKEDIVSLSDGKILYQKGSVVNRAVTNELGIAEITNLPLGIYEVKEVEAPKGYIVSNESQKVVFNEGNHSVSKKLVFKNERKKMNLNIVKKDKDTKIPLSNAKFGIFAGEDIKNYLGKVIVEKDTLIEQVISLSNGKIIFESDLPLYKYYMKELEAPNGYTKSDEVVKVDDLFVQQDFYNEPTRILVSKQDKDDHKELSGALLQLCDESGKVIDTWVSSSKPHEVKGLIVGKNYILKEKESPDGYLKAQDVVFTVKDSAEVQNVVMVDMPTQVEISKLDKDGNYLENAKMQIIDKESQKVIKEFRTGKEALILNGELNVGKTYILKEMEAPLGYVCANNIEFTVMNSSEVQRVIMVDKKVTFSKLDITNNEELEGAKIIVIDKVTGKEVDSWISTQEIHEINNLVENRTYILKEITAPYGYEIAESIEFTVSENKLDQHIEMKDKPILIDLIVYKIDSKSEKMINEDVEFALYSDKECKNKLMSATDKGTITFENLRYGTYYLKEVSAPKGYLLNDETIEIVIDEKVAENYEMIFENQPIEIVDTGDHQRIVLYLAGMLLPVSYILIMKYMKKKNG